jgi:hypothetical protein
MTEVFREIFSFLTVAVGAGSSLAFMDTPLKWSSHGPLAGTESGRGCRTQTFLLPRWRHILPPCTTVPQFVAGWPLLVRLQEEHADPAV